MRSTDNALTTLSELHAITREALTDDTLASALTMVLGINRNATRYNAFRAGGCDRLFMAIQSLRCQLEEVGTYDGIPFGDFLDKDEVTEQIAWQRRLANEDYRSLLADIDTYVKRYA